jgi:hypothetical protein
VVTLRTLLAEATGVTRGLVTIVEDGYRNHIISPFDHGRSEIGRTI